MNNLTTSSVPANRAAVAITGASGFKYALTLIQSLITANWQVELIISKAGYAVASLEEGLKLPGNPEKLAAFLANMLEVSEESITAYGENDWLSPLASGTTKTNHLIICPCTSGTLAAIANGMSDNLIERAADVMLKEKKHLMLVHRETPLSAIQLENSLKLAKMGATILPANPGFYQKPQTVQDLINFVVARILDHLGIEHNLIPTWGEK